MSVPHADAPTRADLLDAVERALRLAVGAQHDDPDPEHADFYAWGWLLTVVAEGVEDVGRTVAVQVGDHGVRHHLRDDAGMSTGERVDRIADALDEVVGYARLLRDAAARFHSETGHIAIEDAEGDGP